MNRLNPAPGAVPAMLDPAIILDHDLDDATCRLMCWIICQPADDLREGGPTVDEMARRAARDLDWHPTFVHARLRSLAELGYVGLNHDEGA